MNVLLQLRHRLKQALDAIDRVDRLIDYASQQQAFTDYLLKHAKYQQVWPLLTTRRDADTFLNHIQHTLHICLLNANVLELGPGHGYFLDAVHDCGAHDEFIDYNPYLVAYNQLRGYVGYEHDWFDCEALPMLPVKYDVVFSKGALNADRVNRWIAESGRDVWHHWLRQVEKQIAMDGCFFLCPTFDPDADGDHTCLDHEGLLQSAFTEVLMQRGYTRMFVEGFNDRLRFPDTFWWRRA